MSSLQLKSEAYSFIEPKPSVVQNMVSPSCLRADDREELLIGCSIASCGLNIRKWGYFAVSCERKNWICPLCN